MAAEAIDNSALIARYIPEKPDGDTFLYTELLDRSKKTGGSNRYRLLRTFRHHSRDEFAEQMPMIRELCDQTGIRAYIRLSPRSYAAVGKVFTQRVLEAALIGHWKDMSHVYASACGRTSIKGQRLWLYDVDEVTSKTKDFAHYLDVNGWLNGIIPSRKGEHLIVRPHNTKDDVLPPLVQIHRDNPTNLYIPAKR